MNIDAKTLQIMYELHNNCRIPLKELARKLHISKEATHARIKNIEKSKLIETYTLVLNLGVIDYKTNRIFLTFYPISNILQDKIILELSKQDEITKIIRCRGIYDLSIEIKYKSIEELYIIITNFEKKYHNTLKIEKILMELVEEFYSKGFLNKGIKDPVKNKFATKISIDEIDTQILNQLVKNAKKSILELSKITSIPYATIKNRMNKLNESNLIAKYCAITNNLELGLQTFNVRIKSNNPIKYEKLLVEIREQPNIIYFSRSLDEYPIDITISCRNYDEYKNVIDKLKESVNNDLTYYSFEETKLIKFKQL